MEQSRTNRRKVREGIVISDKMDGTILVKVERKLAHPLYKKIIRRNKKYMADDPENQAKIGDVVKIMETRPLSKNKKWRLLEILRRAKGEV
ncbi:MAG: 30S ribosomal protein S17 [bacterium]